MFWFITYLIWHDMQNDCCQLRKKRNAKITEVNKEKHNLYFIGCTIFLILYRRRYLLKFFTSFLYLLNIFLHLLWSSILQKRWKIQAFFLFIKQKFLENISSLITFSSINILRHNLMLCGLLYSTYFWST